MNFDVMESNNLPLENKFILSTIGCFERKQLPAITLEKGAIYVGEMEEWAPGWKRSANLAFRLEI